METIKNGAIKFLQWIMPFGMPATIVTILIAAGILFFYGYLRRRRGIQTVALGILGFDALILIVCMLILLTSET
jgi:hypothetical protein